MKLNSILLIGLLLSVGGTTNASPLGTAFTYQGRLADGTNAANNLYDLDFALFEVPTGGSQLGLSITCNGFPVSNGLFTVTLDFGASPFVGEARWLQIQVRTNGGKIIPWTPLSPRQALTPSPYALYAPSAGTALATAAGAVGTLSLAPGAVTSDKIADGTLTAADLSPTLASNTFWRLGGNAGTLPGLHFVGTTDGQPLELRVNGQRALRLEPGLNGAPNVVGGSVSNRVAAGVSGATIAGGGNASAAAHRIEANYGSIGGGNQNTLQTGANLSTIAGGYGNTIQTSAFDSSIGGGAANTIQTNAFLSAIGGGSDNLIQANAKYATIAGGEQNTIQTDAYRSTIGGGSSNTIHFSSWDSTIGGGIQNTIWNNAVGATVSGGYRNNICSSADNYGTWSYSTIAGGHENNIGYNMVGATVSGGYRNNIYDGADYSAIGGGSGNKIGYNSRHTVVSGGLENRIFDYAHNSAIGGGSFNHIGIYSENATVAGGRVNTIGTNSSYSAIGGGRDNDIGNNAQYAYAAGRRAKANHSGSFVWADSTDADFGSSGNDQFVVRASGGVQLSPGTSLYCGTQTRQMLNLWSTNYGIGVQGNALYFRTGGAQAGNSFVWYRGGSHNDAYLNGGADSLTLMSLNVSGLSVSGVINATAFNPSSDRNLKENFAAVSPREVLDKVAALPISRWNFKGDPATPHIGPMAQDFRAAFALGADDKHIATVDADGVALAAIQGLNQKLEAKNAALEQEMAELKTLVKTLAEKVNGGGQ